MPQSILYTLPALPKKRIMAQTLPPSPDASAPLPRYERKRASAAKSPRPRFQAADAALTALFIAASFALNASLHNGHGGITASGIVLALTAGVTYLLGWRCGGRTCGIVAGGLTAFSLSFAQASVSLDTALLTLLIVAALFAFACEAAMIACALVGFAAAVRPDGALLGLLLLVVIAVRTRRQLLPSLGVFLAAVLAGGSLRVLILHMPFLAPALYTTRNAIFWLLKPAQSLTVWLLIPLCAELTDPVRRMRWLPTALWGAVSLAIASCVHFGGVENNLLPLMPIVFVLAAGGLTRLMPSLAGELPAARYMLATLAIVTLLLLRGHLEWPRPTAAAMAPVSPSLSVFSTPDAIRPAAPPMAVGPRPVKVIHKVRPKTPDTVRLPSIALPPAKKPTPKPTVALYTLRNGRLVHRTKWAIQWDLTHPKAKP